MKHVLPIDQYLPEIAELLSRSPCLILEAEPGAGKSTRVPLELLKANWLLGRKIVMLEPRRLAVRSIARYLASQLGEKEGQTIGYSIKNESRISKDTRLEIVTEGILLRRLQRDPELEDTALIIFDEFHERSLQADLALALSQYVQNILRDDLKILVMSATMDSQTISQKLNNAPIIQCAGRNFPVDCFYESNTVGQNLNLRIKNAVFHALESQAGDILVFLPGMKEIKQVTELLTESLMSRDILLCPLYGGLNNEEQDQAIRPSVSGKRKIVLATNIAETSLTIEGIGCVVDGGLHRRARFNPKSGMTQLVTETISRASAEQRKGRAGRLAAGSCYRIWTESQQNMLIAQQPEEILVADLADLSLELAAWSIQDTTDLSWITPPPAPHLSQARDLLQQLELLDQQNQITRIGTEALRLGVHPRLARMLLKSRDWNLGYLACDLAALLAERDLFRRDSNGSSDLTLRLIALQHYRSNRKEALARYPMIRNAAEQALINSKNWQRLLGLKTSPIDSRNDNIYRQSGRLLAQAYPDRVARLRQNSDTRYLLRNGKGAKLWNDDSLCSEPWIICTELDGKHQESQIYLAATIEQADIETDFTGQITDKESVHLKAGNSKPTATKETCLGAIVLKSTHIREPSSEAIERALVDAIQKNGLSVLPWTPPLKRWLSKVRWLAGYNEDWPKLTESHLLASIDTWLKPYLAGVSSLDKLDLKSALQNILTWEQQKAIEVEAPAKYETPLNKKITIDYRLEQGPVVSVILQELFGVIESPRIGWGKVPITFELLSPARRPIQVTSDLKGFWTSSYKDVCKDMKGQYPKHRWPDDPTSATPGKSIKPR